MAAKGSKSAFVWSKLAAARWEDAWVERLSFLGPGRLAIFALAGSKRIRLSAYGLEEKDAARLVKAFGGESRPMKGDAELLAGNTDAPPLVIRNQLVVVRSAPSAAAVARSHPGRPVLIIPAAMAFGTGDHATTANCLRLLCDVASSYQGTKWEALDLGTGTGILALASRVLGAVRCDAWDFDPACIRAVRENARLNKLSRVPAARVDVTDWAPARQWELVTANLFSDVLIKASSQIVAAVKPGGHIILSGMLAAQAPDTLAVFKKLGVGFDRVVKKGKWVTALSMPVR